MSEEFSKMHANPYCAIKFASFLSYLLFHLPPKRIRNFTEFFFLFIIIVMIFLL